jgi:hypothetical protein
MKGTVYLTSNVTELGEVVISPNRAKYIRNKAIDNLFVNFQKEKTKAYYLTHVEESTTKGGEREVYALLDATLNKVNYKKTFFNWDLNLIQLDRIKNLNENDFAIKGKHIAIEFFPDNLHFFSDKTKADTVPVIGEIYDENKDQFIIKTYPQYPNKKYYAYFIYIINKRDTVLNEVIAQSYSNSDKLTTKKNGEVSYNVSNNFHKYKFVKDTSGMYYLEQIQHLISFNVIDDMPFEITFKTSISISPYKPETQKRGKISRPYSYLLFRSRLPDSPGFWKKYVTP